MIRLLGWLWWWVLPVRRRLAVENFRRAFPDRDPRELRRGVGELAWSYVELLLGRRARVEGLDLVPPTGAICLGGHGGAFDLALISVARHVPVTIFVRTPSNPLAAWLIERLRRRAGLELLPPRDSMAAAYRALERGRVVIFVQDQRHNQGIRVPFFGRPARTSPAFAAMAWRTRAPLLGVWQWREAGGHVIRFQRLDWPVPEDRDEAIRSLTAASQRFYEDRIRTAPHAWLWLHDRWK